MRYSYKVKGGVKNPIYPSIYLKSLDHVRNAVREDISDRIQEAQLRRASNMMVTQPGMPIGSSDGG